MTPSVLRHTRFRLLWASGTISGLGTWLLVVAVPYQAFRLTGSPVTTGVTLALEALPALLLGPWAGVLLDRWNLFRAMWAADLAGAAAVSLIFFADRADRVWLIYVAAFAENLAAAVFRPAARALLPAVVGTGPQLASANTLTALTGSVLRLVAPPLGALLLAGAGVGAVLTADVASYVLSAALIALAGRGAGSAARTRAVSPRAVGPLAELRAGIAELARTPPLRGALSGNAFFLTANAGLTALLVPFTVDRLGAAGYGVGYLISGLGVGFAVGAALSRIALARAGVRRILGTAQLAVAAGFFALFNAPDLATAVGAAVLLGIPGSALLTCVETHIQRTVPAEMLGRVGALFFAVDSLAAITGGLGGPALAAVLGLAPALNAICGFALLAMPVTLMTMPPDSPRPAADPATLTPHDRRP